MRELSTKKQIADEAFQELLQLYVRPYYGKLLHANFVAMKQNVDEDFPAYLTLAARTITNAQLRRVLRDKDWRTRLTAAWFAGITGRTVFIGQLARLLGENRGAYDDQGLCLALGLLGGEASRGALVGYLEANLPSQSYSGHEDWALGALAHLDRELPGKYLDPALWSAREDANMPFKAIQAFTDIVGFLRIHRVLKASPPVE